MDKKICLKVKEQIVRHEGFRQRVYLCTENIPTIGYGRNLESKGLSKCEALILLSNDIDECYEDLKNIFDFAFDCFSEERQLALMDMRYQLGGKGFRSFRKMKTAICIVDWELAAKEASMSKWAAQTPNRANFIIEQLKVA